MRISIAALLAVLLPLAACGAPAASPKAAAAPAAAGGSAKAIFAGGCFWCVESDFEKLPGVISAVSGYTGGTEKNPTYEQVSAHATGHAEAVELTYDPTKVSYAELVEYFWRHIDPTVKDQQFCDHGPQYRSGIYPLDAEQQKIAETSKARLLASGQFKNIYTEIVPAGPFWPAESYHQDYYKTHALQYKYYRYGCGRDARVEQIWGRSEH